MYFRYFIIISPWKSPSPKDALCKVWLKLAQWFCRRRWKCEKFTDRWTDGQTELRWAKRTKIFYQHDVWFSLHVYWRIVNYVGTLDLCHTRESFSESFWLTSVQPDRCRRGLDLNSRALDIELISYLFHFSCLSVRVLRNANQRRHSWIGFKYF